jgi:hypothetical protein
MTIDKTFEEIEAEHAAARAAASPAAPQPELINGQWWPAGTKAERAAQAEQRARISTMTPDEFEAYRLEQLAGRVSPIVARPVVQPDMRSDAAVIADAIIDLGRVLEARRGKR